MATTPRNYINGAWLKKNPQYNFINLDFTEDFLDNLKKLPKNEKGFRKVTLSAQKDDPLKWSIYENDFIPKGSKSGGGPTDELPF